MALTNSQYEHIMKLYEEHQYQNRDLLDERKKRVLQSIPEYAALEDKISSLSVHFGKQLLLGDEKAMSRLKEELSGLRAKKQKLLTSGGFTSDYLDPIYHCSDCKDTGYIGFEKCHCFKQQIVNFLYSQSNLTEFLKENNFAALSYSYYQNEDLLRFKKAVMLAKDFIQTFKYDYHNLFFYGTVGTGKSFLSGCIAKELMDQGLSVIYFSSTALFDRLSQAVFDHSSKEDHDLHDDLYTCDLLIIDDLGTELTTNFSSSQFFSCLNERIIRKKSIIISTNLSLQELRDRYSDRIFSRITSNFDLCKITGPDIRMDKKRLTNRK